MSDTVDHSNHVGSNLKWCDECAVYWDDGFERTEVTTGDIAEWWDNDPRARLLRKLSEARAETGRLRAGIAEHRTATLYAPRQWLNVNPVRPWDERLWAEIDGGDR